MDLDLKNFDDSWQEKVTFIGCGVGHIISLINKPVTVLCAAGLTLAEENSSNFLPGHFFGLRNPLFISTSVLIGLKIFLPMTFARELVDGNLGLGYSIEYDEKTKMCSHRPVARCIRIILNETSKVAFDCSLGRIAAKVAISYFSSSVDQTAIVLSLVLTRVSFYALESLPGIYYILAGSMLV